MERQIIATIYQHLIKNLRSNSKIAKKNFFVKDTLSQKMYFVDKQGNIGYMALRASSQKKEFGTITDKDLSGATMITSEEDKLSFYQNPFLMGKMMKAMDKQLRSLF